MHRTRQRRGRGLRRAAAVAAALLLVRLPLSAEDAPQEKPAKETAAPAPADAPRAPDQPAAGNHREPGRGKPPTAPLTHPHATAAPPPSTHPATGDGTPPFVDATAAVGLDFTHLNGMTGELWFGEVVGSGAALFDYDGDGDLDVFLVQGGPLAPAADGTVPSAAPPPSDRLFKNLLRETGELRFEDVTAASGIEGTGYGMGAAVGDVDGDGDPDLYVTNLGSNRLWINRGDGTFEDGTAGWHADDPRWSTAATFFDADLDGDLDLFVASYVVWTPAHPERCRALAGYRDYCGPLSYAPAADRLLENRGDRFLNATVVWGIGASYGGALGALAHDLAGDPRPEVYVANDASANQLWSPVGDRGGAWRDLALESGVALNGAGRPEGSMGVDLGDYDGDGDLDLVVAHVHHETNTLYENDGAGGFTDATERAGLGRPSLGLTGFGAGFLDYDNDGRLDLLVANGTVTLIRQQAEVGDPYPLHQTNQLYRNLGADETGRVTFADVSASAGDAFALSEVTRGAAFGDLDDDGDVDVLLTNSNGPARLLLNQVGNRRHWLGLRLLVPTGRGGDDADPALRDDPTARATVHLPDGRSLLRRVRVDGSYLSAHDPRLLFGLGDATRVRSVTVRWSDGDEETWGWSGRPVDRYGTLVKGTAPAAEP